VRDLEEKIKAYDESSLTSSESMTDLKREVARFKDSENNSGQYIAELEARLARSDESIITLQQTVEKLETMCERRQDEIAVLQNRLETLTRDGESWRSNLEEREKKMVELEAKMVDWERKRKEAGEERARLGVVVGEVAQARKSLETVNALTPGGSELPSRASTPLNKGDLELEAQLCALQQTHTATLADLSNVTSKYRDALQEITDLAAQIQELKLNHHAPTVPPSPASERVEIPSTRRRIPTRSTSNGRELVEPHYDPAGRRLFFRQAASAEGLHAR
jgi:chromosome segregation ATPase